MTATATHPIDAALESLRLTNTVVNAAAAERALREVYNAGRDSASQAVTELVRWEQVARVWVPGVPSPGGSKQPFVYQDRVTGKHRASMADAGGKKTKLWRASVAAQCRAQWRLPMLNGPVSLDVLFYMPRPKKHYRTGRYAGELRPDAPDMHTIAPDATKLMRSTEDAMKSIVWRDDCLVCQQSAVKLYHAKAGKPGALIVVSVPADEQGDLFQPKESA
ncbi:MAG: RusA family crossover junction endodeoxyribonuclease [Mycobacterium sp.]